MRTRHERGDIYDTITLPAYDYALMPHRTVCGCVGSSSALKAVKVHFGDIAVRHGYRGFDLARSTHSAPPTSQLSLPTLCACALGDVQSATAPNLQQLGGDPYCVPVEVTRTRKY